MRVAFQKSTNKVINDFQSNATEDGLIQSAIKVGIIKSDIDIRDVSPEEFKSLEEQTNRVAREDYAVVENQRNNEANLLQQKLALTDGEVKALNRLLTLKG